MLKVSYLNTECACKPIFMGNTTGDNFVSIARYDYSSLFPGAGTVIGVNSAPRFNSIRNQYREFAITGVKVEVCPLVQTSVAAMNDPGGVQQNVLQNINVWDDIDATSNWTVPDYTTRFIGETFKMLKGD